MDFPIDFSLLFLFLVLALYFASCIRIIYDYEKGVIYRLGRLLDKPKDRGLRMVFYPIDRLVRVSLRLVTLDVPPQDIITKDNIAVKVNAVVYFRVVNPLDAINKVEHYLYATSQLAQTSMRSVLGQVELDDLLAKREDLNTRLQSILDQATDQWGVKIVMVEIKQVDIPDDMKRVIAKQAEAEREKRAKIIHAEGELLASEQLRKAATEIAKEPVAVQLRYLQTVSEIGVERNTTIFFPIPIDLFNFVGDKAKK